MSLGPPRPRTGTSSQVPVVRARRRAAGGAGTWLVTTVSSQRARHSTRLRQRRHHRAGEASRSRRPRDDSSALPGRASAAYVGAAARTDVRRIPSLGRASTPERVETSARNCARRPGSLPAAQRQPAGRDSYARYRYPETTRVASASRRLCEAPERVLSIVGMDGHRQLRRRRHPARARAAASSRRGSWPSFGPRTD